MHTIATLRASGPAKKPAAGIACLLFACAVLGLPAAAWAGEAARVFHAEGDVRIANRPAKVGDIVAEGDQIATGANGYIYMKTVDDGTLILRPKSKARIVAYHVDAAKPENTRIKFELLNGIAQSKSGNAVKAARQNFRFNTPVAAIGVRGTDFTVYTDAETSRVSVLSGGIVVSGFGGACSPEGNGPCEGSASRELMANQAGQMLQVQRGQMVPQLMSGTVAVDAVPAPVSANKVEQARSAPAPAVVILEPKKDTNLLQVIPTPGSQPQDPGPVKVPPVIVDKPPEPVQENVRQIIWGRFAKVAGKDATIDVKEAQAGGAQVQSLLGNYVVLRGAGNDWRAPTEGRAGFVLRDSEAYVLNSKNGKYSAATIENGKLDVDFAASSFTTSFDLVTGSERFARNAEGYVDKTGVISGSAPYGASNMSVQGAMAPEKDGIGAAYVFRSVLDKTRIASGVTAWGAKP